LYQAIKNSLIEGIK